MGVRAWGLAGILALAGTMAAAQDLRILTSYEAEVVEPVLEAFEARHPGVTVRHLNKNTNAALSELVSGNARGFDLFWASAPEAFEVLKQAGRLQGSHVDFAYSAVGWTWRAPFEGGPPQDWNDLLAPDYAGRIGMSHPMQSGTTHSLIETILQDRGWTAGWAWLLELSGQLNTISARSFGVLEGVEQGRFDIGLTIDFLALKRSGAGLVFRYGRPIIIIPARIAVLEGGANAEDARIFVDFLLSSEGQRLLLRPDIRRIPVNPEIRAELAETLLPAVRAALQFSWSRYDPGLASRRYAGVNQLFESFIARDFLRRRDLWWRWRALPLDAPQRASVRAILTHMPVSEHQARTAVLDRETLIRWSRASSALLDRAEAGLAE